MAGFWLGLKCTSEPEDDIELGRCGRVSVDGEQRSHKRRSMSWQHFVRSEGADVEVLRQLPLYVSGACMRRNGGQGG